MPIQVLYGIKDKYIDITEIVFTNFFRNSYIEIPENDVLRAKLFTDPCENIVKHIVITDDKKTIYFANYNIKHYVKPEDIITPRNKLNYPIRENENIIIPLEDSSDIKWSS